jgi:predicted nucleic acid-binding protein
VSRVTLLDVNVLVALFDPDHVHHGLAHDWFHEQQSAGWATCPLTENGLVRVLSSPRFREAGPAIADIAGRLHALKTTGRHTFWPDGVSITDDPLSTDANAGPSPDHACLSRGLGARERWAPCDTQSQHPLGAIVGANPDLLQILQLADS